MTRAGAAGCGVWLRRIPYSRGLPFSARAPYPFTQLRAAGTRTGGVHLLAGYCGLVPLPERRIGAESAPRAAAVPACSTAAIGFGCSLRRIRLATLLASSRRSIPRRKRYWLRCSREQKSSPAPTQIRLSGFPQSRQVLAFIPG